MYKEMIKIVNIEQDIELLKRYPTVFRSNNHKFKKNNWLKIHNQPMRRKPYKLEKMMIVDEFNNIR